ncbi:hypothetical protein PORY_001022 [Pneumocystis oryctolagi]|uniref:Uncharacterized protein n=1 Tax=Pneumocystis oryctolagi TaxID=42067 RepID=A0ACB7CCV7_9ASCO|nr:hypothetical protein PORY_001022 [Pneumocystis oryctolagi]
MPTKNVFIKCIIVACVLFVFMILFHHTRPQIRIPFVPTKNSVFDVENPFFLQEKTPFSCYIIGECNACPESVTTPPCDKEPRYRLNIHCIYDKDFGNISNTHPLPSWVSCTPPGKHETAHFFMVQLFLIVTSISSVFLVMWRRKLRQE